MSTQTSLAGAVQGTAAAAGAPAPGFKKYYVLFFFSGFPALLYQIVWQRALFTIYGVNIESVTIIVAMFMLGLGLGSLLGGKLSRRSNAPLLAILSAIELGIAAFGWVSLRVFHQVATFTAGASTLGTGIATFVLLLLPTLLMGSTLPLLVAHLVRGNGNVGESVGALYFVNTLGSAVACFCAAFFLMNRFGQSGSLKIAAVINICVAAAALAMFFQSRGSAGERELVVPPAGPGRECAAREVIPFSAGALLCGAAGFIALGYEMLWYRLFSFASGRSARCFAMMLGWYLAGLAYGALVVRDGCRNRLSRDLNAVLRAASTVIIWGSVTAFLVGPALALLLSHVGFLESGFPLVFISAALLGAAFPLISHASIDPEGAPAGTRVSLLYLSNILGCTAGSYLVGFIAMDHLSTRGVSALLMATGLLMGIGLRAAVKGSSMPMRFWGTMATAGIAICAAWPVYSHLYERLLLKTRYTPNATFRHLVENRNGVIAVTRGNVVFGGGVYDGWISTDLVNDVNLIYRPYALNALHPHPKEVLIIGLSGGAWTQVIANNPEVERITVVEINPGYLQFIPQRSEVASILHNPKVEFVIDDGRRWLVSHPGRQFDAIVMNTSQHWLAHSSNLLSVDFLQLIRQHLKPGGIHYYNTTSSPEAMMTGLTVFPYGMRVTNFMAVSDQPFEFDRERLRATLSSYKIDGRPVFDLSDPAQSAALDHLLALAKTKENLESAESLRARFQGVRLITDDNMGLEWQEHHEPK